MFFKPTVFITSALVALAAATPTPGGGSGSGGSAPASSCSTGPVQCCNSVQSASSPAAAGLLGLLGIVIQDVTAQVGLGCSPITVIGAGTGSCNAQAVCCQDNSHGGLISVGCLPVTL